MPSTIRSSLARPVTSHQPGRKYAVRLALAVASLGLLAGCKADVEIGVRARPEGSGVVRVRAVLDGEAAAWLGPPEKALATDDLEARGWSITSPTTTDGGGVTFGAEHGFRTVAEANQLLTELTGPDGPFSKLRLSRSRSLTKTTITLSGPVDLSKRLEAFGDDALRDVVGAGSRIGMGEEELAELGASADKLTISLQSIMGGSESVVALPLGATTAIDASGKVWAWEAAAGLGGALAGLLGLLVIWRAKQ